MRILRKNGRIANDSASARPCSKTDNPQVTGEQRGELWYTLGLQDAENFVASDTLNLSNTVRVSENNTNLRRSETLLRALNDLVNDLGRCHLQP